MEENIEFFKWLFDKEEIELESMIDLTLCHNYDDPHIYYPKELGDLFRTSPMKRISRVLQLGKAIDYNSNTYHTRFEHCLGVYNQKKNIIMNLYKNQEFRKYIENNNLKLNLIAELIKSAGHDIGHLPLSHIIEISVIQKRDFHESMGKRILLENPEIIQCMEKIDSKLPLALKEVLENDVFGLEMIDEGNYDIDRFDYITRDYLYKGNQLDLKFEPFELVPVSMGKDSQIQKNDDNSIIENNNGKFVPVFDISSLDAIEEFLRLRKNSYEQSYFHPLVQIRDAGVSVTINKLIEKKSKFGIELQQFLQYLTDNKDPSSIDLDYYLSWDDPKFYSQILDVAENGETEELRSLSTVILPNLQSLMSMIYTMMNLKDVGFKNLSEEDKLLVKKIKSFVSEDTELAKNLRNQDYLKENISYTTNSENIKKCKETKNSNIFVHSQKLLEYKESELIFIRNSDGKIYTIDELPNRQFEMKKEPEFIEVAFCYPKILPVDKEIIEKYMKPLDDLDDVHIKQSRKVNMSPVKTEHNINECFGGIEI